MGIPNFLANGRDSKDPRPLPAHYQIFGQFDNIGEQDKQLNVDNISGQLLQRTIELCSQANTQFGLDAPTITRLQAVKLSTNTHLQIKNGLILHTTVLASFYKRRPREDLYTDELAAQKHLAGEQRKIVLQVNTT